MHKFVNKHLQWYIKYLWKAPDDWITDVYGSLARLNLSTPHYLVFLDVRQMDIDQPETLYVGQDFIDKLNQPKEVFSLVANDYFEKFSNGKHQMRPWLKKLYPNDI